MAEDAQTAALIPTKQSFHIRRMRGMTAGTVERLPRARVNLVLDRMEMCLLRVRMALHAQAVYIWCSKQTLVV